MNNSQFVSEFILIILKRYFLLYNLNYFKYHSTKAIENPLSEIQLIRYYWMLVIKFKRNWKIKRIIIK